MAKCFVLFANRLYKNRLRDFYSIRAIRVPKIQVGGRCVCVILFN